MQKYQKPFLEDEVIEIEDIINDSLTNGGTRGPEMSDDEGEEFSS